MSATRVQREKIKQFMSFTSTREEFALRVLERCRWDVDYAVNWFLTSEQASGAGAHRVDVKAIEKLYETYKDPKEPKVGPEGVMQFCEDLGVEPTDMIVLVIAWRFNAKKMGEFTHPEFVEGFKSIGVDSLTQLKAQFPAMLRDIEDLRAFKDFYLWVFDYAKEGGKTVELEMAQNLWELLLGSKFKKLNDWFDFVKEKKIKNINRDTWNMLLELSRALNDDFSNYDPDGAFPVIMDEFVEFVKERQAK